MDTATNKGKKLLTAFQREQLIKSLQGDLHKFHRQGIEIMLLADSGLPQSEICRTLGCSQPTARGWILKVRSGMALQWQDCPIGRPKKFTDELSEHLKQLVSLSPRDCGYSFDSWSSEWLRNYFAKNFDIKITAQHLNKLRRKMGLSTRQKASNS